MVKFEHTLLKWWFIWLLAASAGVSPAGCGSQEPPDRLRVLVADSLARPFRALAVAFEAEHRDVRIVLVSSGSVLAAHRLVHGNDRADVLAVADYQVIDRLMRPGHADWSICFATNEIGITYTDMSRGAAELTVDNWFHILARPDVKVQAANPHHDPCGYWTELCWRLADLHYQGQGVSGQGTIHERMTDKCGPAVDRRTDSQQLLRLVESAGGIDYAFVYRSQALQHNQPFLRLPPQINLGDADHVASYRRVAIELPGRKSGSRIEKRGDAIVFALTIPKDAARPQLAEQFVAFMLSPAGRAVLKMEHVDVMDRPWTYDLEQMPVRLRSYVVTRPRNAQVNAGAG